MFYFLNFLIIYLLFSKSSKATEDFDDYDSVEYMNSGNDARLTLRQATPNHKNIPENFIGSNLFGSGIFSKQCFSVEDVALLSTRCKFETLMPNMSTSTQKLENDKSVEVLMEYFYGLNEMLNIIEKEDVKYFAQQAFYDVVGGYLNYFYWPLVKYSFYAGMLTYNTTISVYSLQKHCKDVLNTIGNGWRHSKNFFQTKCKIEPISPIGSENTQSMTPARGNPCDHLLLVSNEDDTYRTETELIVSLPQIETEDNDGILNIRLPFKRKQIFNFNSKASAFVLLKYYVTVSQCYDFRKEKSERFDWRFLKLMKEKFMPFLQRDEFYAGFGAILRIYETLNRRSIVYRNIDDNLDEVLKQFANETHGQTDDSVITMETDIYKNQQNDSTFFEQVVHMITFETDNTNESKKMELIFCILVASIIFMALLILCCCLIRKRRQKKSKKSISDEGRSEEKDGCFKSLLKKFKKDKKEVGKNSMTQSNIGPRSSSILQGNDFDDTESRISSQTKSSGLSLKDLIHAEISKRPSKPSKEQIKALSRNTKKFTSAQMTDLMEHS